MHALMSPRVNQSLIIKDNASYVDTVIKSPSSMKKKMTKAINEQKKFNSIKSP